MFYYVLKRDRNYGLKIWKIWLDALWQIEQIQVVQVKIPKDIEHKKIMHLFHRIQKANTHIIMKIHII